MVVPIMPVRTVPSPAALPPAEGAGGPRRPPPGVRPAPHRPCREELRLTTLEDRVEADLSVRFQPELVAELTGH
ncbi:hypothetical protein, partial [Streptosporangium sp. NPDC048865]|uniref:hypothetical protein n=1 Tax=Streptosporangium sp. NPDC048865 TaxID=3155766 RepID=UPI00341725F5